MRFRGPRRRRAHRRVHPRCHALSLRPVRFRALPALAPKRREALRRKPGELPPATRRPAGQREIRARLLGRGHERHCHAPARPHRRVRRLDRGFCHRRTSCRLLAAAPPDELHRQPEQHGHRAYLLEPAHMDGHDGLWLVHRVRLAPGAYRLPHLVGHQPGAKRQFAVLAQRRAVRPRRRQARRRGHAPVRDSHEGRRVAAPLPGHRHRACLRTRAHHHRGGARGRRIRGAVVLRLRRVQGGCLRA